EVALKLLGLRFPVRIVELQLLYVTQVEHVDDRGRLLAGGIQQVDPEDLVLAQPVERLGPVLDLRTLPLVKEVGHHHPTVTCSRALGQSSAIAIAIVRFALAPPAPLRPLPVARRARCYMPDRFRAGLLVSGRS